MTPRRVVVPAGFAVFLVVASLGGVVGGYAIVSALPSEQTRADPPVVDDGLIAANPQASLPTTATTSPATDRSPPCLALKDFPQPGSITSLIGHGDPYETSLRKAVKDVLAPAGPRAIRSIEDPDREGFDPNASVLLAPYSKRAEHQVFMDQNPSAIAVYYQSPAEFKSPDPTRYGAVLLVLEPKLQDDYREAKFLIAHLILHGSSVCQRPQKA